MKLRTTLTKRLVVISGISILLTALCCCIASWITFSEQAYSDLSTYCKVLTDYYNPESSIDDIKPIIIGGYRLTVVNSKGNVIYESDKNLNPSEMGNYLNRPEIKQAIKNGIGESTRYSSTSDDMVCYYAMKMKNGNIIRVSKSVHSFYKLFYWTVLIVIAMCIYLLILCFIISSRFTKKIVKPFENIKLEDINKNFKIYKELKPFTDTIISQQRKIRNQFEALQEERDKINTLISNMQEGFIMLDIDKVILVENDSAKRLLKNKYDDNKGKNMFAVYSNDILIDSINKASKGKSTETELKLNKKTIRLYTNPVFSGGEAVGVICLLVDITEKKKTEKLRREFTANVTHELKTPLTSISGYAEMIENGMVTNEDDMRRFAGRIHKEAGRLISLIADIMKLSKMDDNAYKIEDIKKVNLKDMVNESISVLDIMAEKNNITFITDLQNVTCSGNETQLYELIFNLCDNAIRYNKLNGKVYVTLCRQNNIPVLTVKDTGIGIDKKHQPRIFERFYRVDKSRSKETGGTGLGLAIVKHIAELHNAKITINSELNKGTEITVMFCGDNNGSILNMAER
ncbi:MAG: ATP-binding protein [Acutalibacteraceae bacterium]|nr:ATP-binding protein [Acutalibacteraceae bacterium]